MSGYERRIRDVLAGLRRVLDADDPLSALGTPDARAIVDDAWEALSDLLGHSEQDAHEVAQTLQQLRQVDRLLLRTQETAHADISRRLGNVIARLEAAPHSVQGLVTLAAQLISELGFDRALVSHISDGYWVPQEVFIIDNPDWAAEILDQVGQRQPQRLVPELYESELVRRRQAIMVTNVQHEARVHRPIAEASLSRSYVAAPIVAHGQVLGFLHADRYMQGVDTDLLDRETLRTFAEALRLALSRAQIAEQLDSTSSALRRAATDADNALRGLHNVSLKLGPDSGEDTLPAAARTGTRSIASVPPSVRERLTNRETQILELMAQGRTNASIAVELVISEGTVKQHVKSILRKLRVANRTEAVARMGADDLA